MATLEQIESALRKADAAGNIEDARALAQAYREMKGQSIEQLTASYPKEEPKLDDPSFLVGMGKRFNDAARGIGSLVGNPDLLGVEPYAPADKRISESNMGRFGEMAADAALTAPAGLGASALTRVLGTALTEGVTNENNRGEAALTGAVGSGIGEGIGSLLKFGAKPFQSTQNPVKEDLIKKASALSIPLNAAQNTGNKALQYMDSALDSIPSSSSFQQTKKEMQRKAWQKALFAQGGETADGATQDVMGTMKDRIGNSYQDIHSRNNLIIDQDLKDALSKIEQNQLRRLPTNQKPVVQSYLDDLNAKNIGDTINGGDYQDLRSMLDKQAKGFSTSDPLTANALKDIRSASDSAMQRNMLPYDKQLLNKANSDWAVMKSMERAIDPTTGNVSPALLINGLKKQDANRVIYGKGNQDLTDIAKVGKEFITNKVPDSGTAQRAAMIKMLTGAGIAGAGADMATGDNPLDSAGTGLLTAVLAATLPKQAAKMMWKDNGYLSKGLLDLNKEIMPKITKSGLLDFVSRNAGLQSAKSVNN